MSRPRLNPLMTFSDGSQLVISTQCSREGEFSCALYTASAIADDRTAFQLVSNLLSSATCMGAQEHAYDYAIRHYPRAAELIKKPPYLIWRGPPPAIPH
jgi:hypothetical protein